MTEKYQPKVGDRVRVVLEGEVTWFKDELLELGHSSHPSTIDMRDVGGVVSIEKVAPHLPTTPGSVVRYCGLTFMRRSDGEWVGAHPEKLGRSNFLYSEVPPEQCEVIFDAGEVTP